VDTKGGRDHVVSPLFASASRPRRYGLVPLLGLVVLPGLVVLSGLVAPLGEVLGAGLGRAVPDESDSPAPLSLGTLLPGMPPLSLTPALPPIRLLSAPSRRVSVAPTRPGCAAVSTPPAPV
jgi:hypothetical protein